MKVRVADYIAEKLYEAGGEHVFLITGGMILHLTDALLNSKGQKFICCHHEQAAVMAAEAYGRYTGKLGVAFVTAGPGALNTITGVVGAYVDSSPCIVVAGQSKVSQAKVTGPRQFPLQGFENLPLFKNITKYAVMLDDPRRVKYELEKCIHIAKAHRVGPVYLECPIDIQGAFFDPDECEGYTPPEMDAGLDGQALLDKVEIVKDMILNSRRPCILGGAGVRLSGAVGSFNRLVERTGIPVITARLGMDLTGHDNPLFIGRPGLYGDRAANTTVQNADLLLSIGCRLAIGLVGYDFENFAHHAKKVVVDIDEKELAKPSVKADVAVCADADRFINLLLERLGGYRLDSRPWVSLTQKWKEKYPVELPEYKDEKEGINSYHFMTVFSEMAPPDAVFAVDTGSCFHVHAQAFKVKFGQRHIITGGLSTMGYMPSSIGVAAAHHGRDVYCISGDGSMQMNIQELETIVFNKLPVKIIVLNNNGYLLIRNTQNNLMDGRLIGESADTGVGFPDMMKIAGAYGIPFMRVAKADDLDGAIKEMMAHHGPLIFEVMTPPNQLLIPRVAPKKLEDGSFASMPYDDMFPFLPREEYLENCVHNKIN